MVVFTTIGLVVLLWVFYPSPLVVAGVSLMGSVAPGILLSYGGPELFNSMRIGIITVTAFLFAGVTQFVRKTAIFNFPTRG
ncbi:MAG: hypothetical protein JWO19_2246 [Bryobacterales bacterium]|nr:hypothetical protein [Bryobacterales bacterium]